MENGHWVHRSLARGPWSPLLPRLDLERGPFHGKAHPLRAVLHERGTNPRVTKEEEGRAPLMADSSKVKAFTQESSSVMKPLSSSQFYACKTALLRISCECCSCTVLYVLGGRPHYQMRLCLLF